MSTEVSLSPLFEADRVAIIGASERNQYAANIFRNLEKFGFDLSRVIPINPNRPEVFGLKAYPSVLEVPGEVPLAVVATNTTTALSVMPQLEEKKVKGAIVYTDGFSEDGARGELLQRQLTDAARAMGLRLVGPNCMGLVSVRRGLGLWAGEIPALRPGNVACVFHSSGMLNLFLALAHRRGIGFHVAVSGGNEAILNAADYFAYAAAAAEVDVIVMYMEAAVEREKFIAGLDRALANGKSVIVLRAGRTERARRNVIAHTGKLAGSAASWDALLDQHGAVLVNDLDELLETTVLFASTPVRPDAHERGVALVTISGGDCTLLCDVAEQEGVPLPELSPETLQTMVESLEKPTLIGNPLDVESLQRQNRAAFDHCLATLFAEPRVDTIGVRLNFPRVPTDSHVRVYEQVVELRAASGKRVVVLSRASEPLAEEWYALFRRLELPFVQEYRKGLRALARLLRNESERARGRFVASPRVFPAPGFRPQCSGVLPFATAAQLLSDYGIPLAPWQIARSADEAAQYAGQIGYPCVLKLSSVDVPHKTEYGALALGLKDAEEVRTAYRRIVSSVREKNSAAEIEGVIVQPHLSGVECLLGVAQDPQLGPTLVLGLGGVLVEVLKDIAVRIPPISAAEALHALNTLRGRQLLRGFRGAPPADIEAVAEMAARLSWLAYDMRDEITEIDLNPVLAFPGGGGAQAVDVLIVARDRRLK